MARKKPAAAGTAKVSIDPRSGEPILFLVERKHGEFPARDLSGSDLNRVAYRRALREDPTTRPPDRAEPQVLEAIAGELVDGGFYTRNVSRGTPPAPADPPNPDAEPVTPAEEPEVRS